MDRPQVEATTTDAVPASIDRFELVRLMKEAGMGRLYVARHPTLGKEVVLKTLNERVRRGSATAVARLRREAELLGRLDHEGICPVLDFFEAEGQQYVVLPLIEGEDLSVAVARAAKRRAEGASMQEAWGEIVTAAGPGGQRGSLERIAGLVEQIARAVHAAHEAAVIHRDLKPSNVMVRRDGRAVVLDFGVALDRADAEAAPITASHSTPGTIHYMPPEQLRGDREKVDRPSDVYALGAILYELLTLRRAISARDTSSAVAHILAGRIEPPRTRVPEVPRDLEAVCLKALEREPERRYPTALALAEELQRFQAGQPTTARPLTAAARAARWARRNPALVLTAAGALVVASIAGAAIRDSLLEKGRRAEALDRFATVAAFLLDVRGRAESGTQLPPEDEQRLAKLVPDPSTRRFFLAEPLTRDDFERVLQGVRLLVDTRAVELGGPLLALSPLGGVLGPRPSFRFVVRELPAAGTPLEVEVFAAGEERVIATVAPAHEGESFEIEPATDLDLPFGERCSWTLRPAPGSDAGPSKAAHVPFFLVDPARHAAAIAALPSTGAPDLDALLRASACLSLGLGEAALTELAALPVPPRPELKRLQAQLEAYARALLGQADVVDQLASELFAPTRQN
jgi:tRNA A-37 threonylcarbamoyl transferase component Bud32